MSNASYLYAFREYLESEKGNAWFERIANKALNRYLAEHPEETRQEVINRLKASA